MKLMHVICSNIWRNEIIPGEWTKSIIITIRPRYLNEFKYLGSIITANNSSATDINRRRLGLATGTFGKLDKVWKNKKG